MGGNRGRGNRGRGKTRGDEDVGKNCLHRKAAVRREQGKGERRHVQETTTAFRLECISYAGAKCAVHIEEGDKVHSTEKTLIKFDFLDVSLVKVFYRGNELPLGMHRLRIRNQLVDDFERQQRRQIQIL